MIVSHCQKFLELIHRNNGWVDLFSNLKFFIANIGLKFVVANCVTFGYFISRYSNYTDPFIYPRANHNLEFHACVNIWVYIVLEKIIQYASLFLLEFVQNFLCAYVFCILQLEEKQKVERVWIYKYLIPNLERFSEEKMVPP